MIYVVKSSVWITDYSFTAKFWVKVGVNPEILKNKERRNF